MLLTYAFCGLNLGVIWARFASLMMNLNTLGGSRLGSLVTSFSLFFFHDGGRIHLGLSPQRSRLTDAHILTVPFPFNE